jgi:hypothetical protein
MKRIVWTFGLISGGIFAVMMLATLPFHDTLGFERAEVVGYTTIVLAFLLVFFGIRSYRDNVAGGTVPFGRAFKVGALIALISSVCYVATWQLIYYRLAPDFGDKYLAHMVETARASGDSPTEIEQKVARMQRFAELYKNPAINAAITLIEPLPIGLVMALVSAGILSRKRRHAAATPNGLQVS